MIRDTAWLIEWPEDAQSFPARWWHPKLGWTRNATEALRFSRRVDADDYIASERFAGTQCRSTEHVFLTPEGERGS